MSVAWFSVSKASPCAICGKEDFCQIAGDRSLIMCRRAHLSAGSGGRTKVDRSGVPFTIFGGRKSSAGTTEHTGEVPADVPDPDPVQHQYVVGEPAHLNTVYTRLFEKSTLSFAHEQSLIGRGFTRDEIARCGYRTLPTREQWPLMKGDFKLFAETILNVPGFSLHERTSDKGEAVWSFRLDGPPSLMLPIRDRYGRVVRVQLDVDSESPKYLPLTSYAKKGSRATQATHVPLRDGVMTYAVRLVGGTYKADLLTNRSSVLTISAPSEYSYTACLDDVMALEPAIVCIAADADVRTNSMVAAAFATACILYQSHGYAVAVETWPASCGKGIDDVYANGKEGEVEVLTGVRLWEFVRDVLHASKALPNAGVEARLSLAQLGDEPDSASIFRPAIISALAQFDTASAEYQSLHRKLAEVLGKGECKTLDKLIKKERDKLAEEAKVRRLADLEAAGRRIFHRVSDAALCQVVIDDLTAVGISRTNPDLLKCVRDRLYRYKHYPRGIWEPLDDSAVINLVATYDGSPIANVDGDLLNVSAGKARGVLDLVKANRKDDEFFSEVHRGIAFSNGFLVPNLSTGEMKLEPHGPENRVRWGFDFDYTPDAVPKKYLEFLWRTCSEMPLEEMRDTVACLTQHLGACLMGIATRFETAIFCDGTSGTGNSTILNIHKRIMPRGSVSSVLPHMMDDPFALANLEGALLNIADDLPRKELLDLGRLKSVVTGGWVEAGKKYEQNHPFRVVAGELFACNGLPRVPEPVGMRRRSAILKFTSQVPEDDKNRWLDDDIVTEERAKLVSFALAALSVAIKQNRITVPKASAARVTEWLGEADSFEEFYDDEVSAIPPERRDDKAMQALWPRAVASVYASYKAWCIDRGRTPFGEGVFGKKMRSALNISLEQWKAPPYRRNDGYHYPIILGSERRRVEEDAEHTRLVEELAQKGAWN